MESTFELAVEMTCQKCATDVSALLSKCPDVQNFEVNLEKQSVLVTTSLPSSRLVRLIESQVGKRTVIMGITGSQKRGHLGAAVAMLGGLVGSGAIQGVIRFTQFDEDTCIIDGTLDGLSPGQHGIAVYECGDISGGCSTIGGHYNPRNVRHGSPDDNAERRHVGDLGNVIANEEGRAEFKFADKLVKVSDIIGRAVAVSSDADDMGKGPSPLSTVNGNSGQPLSCGIIARSAGIFENAKRFCACDGVSLWDERSKPLVGPERQNSKNADEKL